MKKFFGLIILAIALVLTSCGANDVAHEKASVEFSIPVADILALQNNVGSKARYGGNEETTFEKILVQIKSDKYYESSLASIPIDSISYDEDGNIRILNDQYLSYYADLEQLAEEYEIPIDIIFSESFVEYLTEYEDLLPKYIEILKNNKLTKTAAIYEETNGEFTQEQGAVMAQEFSSAFVYKDNITFTFDSLEPDTYTVMVDVIEENHESWEQESQPGQDPITVTQTYTSWEYTGEQTIQVFAGQDNPVTVELEENPGEKENLFDTIDFSYEEDGQIKTVTAAMSDFQGSSDYITQTEIPAKYELKNRGGTMCFREFPENADIPSDEGWLELKSFAYIMDDSFHFSTGFDIKLEKVMNNNGEETKEYFSFADNKIELLDQMKKFSEETIDNGWSEYNIIFTQKYDSSEFVFKTFFHLMYCEYEEIKNDDDITSEQEGENEGNEQGGDTPTGLTETAQGSLLNNTSQQSGEEVTQNLVFNKRTSLKDKNRYIYEADLSTILNGKKLSTDDSVVFVMKIPSKTADGTDYNLPFSQLQYELQTEDWEQISDEILYNNNECINCGSYPSSDDYYTFVLPLNFVQTPQTYNKVLFFFDLDFGGTVTNIPTTLTIPVASLDCYIFPASSKTLVFAVGQTYGDATHPFRYEFKQKMVDNNGDMVSLAKDQTVTIFLSGTVKYQGSNNFDEITLDGEIFDGAGYYVTGDAGPSLSYFHSMSNTDSTVTGNVLSVTPARGRFTDDYFFKFVYIQKPYWDKADVEANNELAISHNYQFQCTSTCTDPSVLLIIQGFEMKTSVTE